jgi:hypothetical protein
MSPLILSLRLRLLSHFIVVSMFSREEYSRDDLKSAKYALYEDMMQYKEEHPCSTYSEFYHYFVGAEHAPVEKCAKKYFLSMSILLLLIIGIFVYCMLSPSCNFFLHHIPTYYREIQL